MIIIKNDFLKNPYEVRNFALKQKYNTEGNYPGYRSFQVSDYLKDYILKEAKYHFKDQNLKIYSAFQYVTKDFKEGLFDTDNSKYASIIFLSPNSPKIVDWNYVINVI
jgi:hypothetical protein